MSCGTLMEHFNDFEKYVFCFEFVYYILI